MISGWDSGERGAPTSHMEFFGRNIHVCQNEKELGPFWTPLDPSILINSYSAIPNLTSQQGTQPTRVTGTGAAQV